MAEEWGTGNSLRFHMSQMERRVSTIPFHEPREAEGHCLTMQQCSCDGLWTLVYILERIQGCVWIQVLISKVLNFSTSSSKQER